MAAARALDKRGADGRGGRTRAATMAAAVVVARTRARDVGAGMGDGEGGGLTVRQGRRQMARVMAGAEDGGRQGLWQWWHQ